MNRRNFLATAILGGLAASLGLHASAPKVPLTGYKHTILPPPKGKLPLDPCAWHQYVTVDPADCQHAISYWARSEPPTVIPPGYFNPSSK
jgi:hypothetical protein